MENLSKQEQNKFMEKQRRIPTLRIRREEELGYSSSFFFQIKK